MKNLWQNYPWNDIIRMLNNPENTLNGEEIDTARTLQKCLEAFINEQITKNLRLFFNNLTEE